MSKHAQLEFVGSKIRQSGRQLKLTQVELTGRIGIHQSELKILHTFDIGSAEFCEEWPDSETVLDNYQALSEEARKEVNSFIKFKRNQGEAEAGDWREGEEG